MRTAVLLGLFASALTGCDEGVDLGSFPSTAPYTPPPVLCGATAVTLAQIDNVQSVPFYVDTDFLYVVSTATPGDLTHETLWQIPKADWSKGDAGGNAFVVATDQNQIGGIVVGDTVMWSAQSTGDDAGAGGAIWIWGTAGPTILIPNRPVTGALFLYGERAYWAEKQGIMWAPTSGGGVSTFQQTAADQVPRTFSIAAQNLVWTTANPQSANQASAIVVMAPLPLPFGLTSQIAGPAAGGVGAVESPGYYTEKVVYSGPTGLMSVVPPGPPTQILPLGGFVREIVDDGTDFYFIDPASGELTAFPDEGNGGAPRAVTGPIDPTSSFDVDDYQCAYWVDPTAQTVNTVRK